MANYDASVTNNSKRANRIYKDLDLNFGRNPITNDVNKLTDVEAVKRSVRNLINTNHYERPFHPEIGSGLRGMLFEPMSPLTANGLQRKVRRHCMVCGKRIMVWNQFKDRPKCYDCR